MNMTMVHLHAGEFSETIAFYKLFGFSVHGDDVDGRGERVVRLIREKFNLMINLQKDEGVLLNYKESVATDLPRVAFSLVFDSDADFYQQSIFVSQKMKDNVIKEISQPYGSWIYVQDPAGNRFCLSTSSFY